MAQFAGYGFNKSHSAAYALLAYHTAYWKTHYPVEFMARCSLPLRKHDDVVKYINECREMGLQSKGRRTSTVSDANFTAAWSRHPFRIGRSKKLEAMRSSRLSPPARAWPQVPFAIRILRRSGLRMLNKRVLESLIKSGAMISLASALPDALTLIKPSRAPETQREPNRDNTGSFSRYLQKPTRASEHDKLPDIPIGTSTHLAAEKEILGFFHHRTSAREVQRQVARLALSPRRHQRHETIHRQR